MKIFFYSLFLLSLDISSKEGSHFLDEEKKFLLSKCKNIEGDDICEKVKNVRTYEQLNELYSHASSLSLGEEKELLNRISTLECCLRIHDGKACYGLKNNLKTKAKNCRDKVFEKK